MDKGEELAGNEPVCYVTGEGDVGRGGDEEVVVVVVEPKKKRLAKNVVFCCCSAVAIYQIKIGVGTRKKIWTSANLICSQLHLTLIIANNTASTRFTHNPSLYHYHSSSSPFSTLHTLHS